MPPRMSTKKKCPHCPHTYLHHVFQGANVRGGDLWRCAWCSCVHIIPYKKPSIAARLTRRK